jgi:hypothetical protein
MLVPLLSVDRLRNPNDIESFKKLFKRHGALGAGMPDIPPIPEDTRFVILPLVFGFIPAVALNRPRYDMKIKPSIEEHLQSLRIPFDGELVDIIKNVADQYFRTSPRNPGMGKRKYSISDLRAANRTVYREIKTANTNAVCIVVQNSMGPFPKPLII